MSEAPVDIESVLAGVDYRPGGVARPLQVERRSDGNLRLVSINVAGTARLVTAVSGDPHDRDNLLANVAQHAATSAASDALAHLTYRGRLIHVSAVDGEPHVVVPPRLVDFKADADRAVMLSRRRARECVSPVANGPADAELDAMDLVLSRITFTWPGATVSGLWAERWADVVESDGARSGRQSPDGALYVASRSHRAGLDGARHMDSRGTVAHVHPCSRFVGDPFDRDDVIRAAVEHLAWAAAHECLEYAEIDGERLYDPHRQGEPTITLPDVTVGESSRAASDTARDPASRVRGEPTRTKPERQTQCPTCMTTMTSPAWTTVTCR